MLQLQEQVLSAGGWQSRVRSTYPKWKKWRRPEMPRSIKVECGVDVDNTYIRIYTPSLNSLDRYPRRSEMHLNKRNEFVVSSNLHLCTPSHAGTYLSKKPECQWGQGRCRCQGSNHCEMRSQGVNDVVNEGQCGNVRRWENEDKWNRAPCQGQWECTRPACLYRRQSMMHGQWQW